MAEYTIDDLMKMERNAAKAGDTNAVATIRKYRASMSPNYNEVFAPGTGLSSGEALATSALGAFDRIRAGTQKLVAGDSPELRADQETKQAVLNRVSEEHPVAAFAGNVAPYIPSMFLPWKMIGQTVTGGMLGGSQYAVDQGWNAMKEGLLSAAGYKGGGAVNQMIGKARNINQARRAMPTGEPGRLAQRADDLGMNVSPGNLQDSLPLKQLEASIKSNPATSSVPETFLVQNQRVLNRLAAEGIGEAGDEITGRTLANAADRIGSVFDNIAKGVKEIPVSGLQNYVDNIATDSQRYVDRMFKRFPSLQKGVIQGEEYIRLRNALQKEIRGLWKTNPAAAEDLQDLQLLLNTGLETASPGSRKALSEASRQWKMLKALESGKTVTKGNVNPRSMDTALRRMDKGGYLRQRNESDLYDGLRIANQFGDVVGDSGTATRSYMNLLMTDPTAAATALAMRPLARGYYASGGSPTYAGLLGVVPGNPMYNYVGAGSTRAYVGGTN